ncbi:MAG: CBS domain-containing protein [Candidatus Omnitrophica bacterium]|nr:CBS domain-containing protein [Candidatus Omnitrophota bacterium]
MKIRDVMKKDVISIDPSTGIHDIYRIFCEKRIGGVPVVDKKNNLLGMVTKKELLDVLNPDYFDMVSDFLFIDDFGALEEKLESLPSLELFIAEDLMIKNIITINENASLMKAPALMNKHNVKRLPVVNKSGKLVGIISRIDICHALFRGKGLI